jgi:tetratricopeptide (TPR) repeat protein
MHTEDAAKRINRNRSECGTEPMLKMAKLVFSVVLFIFFALWPLAATKTPTEVPGGGTPAAIDALRQIVADQKAVVAEARAIDAPHLLEDKRDHLQKIVDRYEDLISKYPDFAAAWAAYGLYLCEPLVEEPRPALALLLKANQLDSTLPVVKNQIGVLLAEQGRVMEAFNYFLDASDLAPNEPLYHFQIGLVLDEGRTIFLKTKAWQAADLDRSILTAFRRALELAPARVDFAYRAAEAYYDLAEPRWDEAYAAWTHLEARLTGELELQTVRLHRASVRWQQGLAGEAHELLETVTAPALAAQKTKLLAEFAADEAREKAKARSGDDTSPSK